MMNVLRSCLSLLLIVLLTSTQKPCTPCPVGSDPVCCVDDCLTCTLCRDATDDCDISEYCGTDGKCPPDARLGDASTQSDLQWDWVGNSGQLKVFVPSCPGDSNKFVKTKLIDIEEVDANGMPLRGGKKIKMNKKFWTKQTLSGDQISTKFDTEPSDMARIAATLEVGPVNVDFSLAIFWFNHESSYTDAKGDKVHIPANSLKYDIEFTSPWPFASPDNKLAVRLSLTTPAAKLQITTTNSHTTAAFPNGGGYLSFPTKSAALADGKAADVIVQSSNPGHITAITLLLPNYQNTLIYDPTTYLSINNVVTLKPVFSVLLCVLVFFAM